MSRTKLLQQIYARLSTLDSDIEEMRIQGGKDNTIAFLENEMQSLRIKLQEVMNSPCPLLKGNN